MVLRYPRDGCSKRLKSKDTLQVHVPTRHDGLNPLPLSCMRQGMPHAAPEERAPRCAPEQRASAAQRAVGALLRSELVRLLDMAAQASAAGSSFARPAGRVGSASARGQSVACSRCQARSAHGNGDDALFTRALCSKRQHGSCGGASRSCWVCPCRARTALHARWGSCGSPPRHLRASCSGPRHRAGVCSLSGLQGRHDESPHTLRSASH